ncbi:hypothetical protein [Kineosporia babensis]|uniref:Uncharacterized protein n=1 Tax=Kineosporia babensis TaxID=499548 RepID=A0A9X1NKU2_9ACTN|nr:hypothetical protein [Kineosporia babensis]MCD5316852.1 hypothetical protein [Kineosporia babensis]
MDIASLVSAVAATTGAALAGVSVYISGRRDESKWRREVLLETCEAFLNASFETARAGRQLAGFPAPRDAVTRDEPELRISMAYRAKMDLMTRLRILADENVITAAEDVHLADMRFLDAVSGWNTAPSIEEFDAVRAHVQDEQGRFITATRSLLHIKGRTVRVRNISRPRPITS